MAEHHPQHNGKKFHQISKSEVLRFGLLWLLLLAGLAYCFHRYFEYRNAELDRRLELLKHVSEQDLFH
ncbi:MAG: hypothetical protein IT269_09785 [Saprospiraceae bacterium]|nr:hypothetical protein [Saprospiraceae bacterium]